MKKFVYLIVLVLVAACTTEPQYELTGTLEGGDQEMVYLMSREGGDWVHLDSAQLSDNQFAMTGNVEVPEQYYLQVDGKRGVMAFYLENSEINISGHVDSLYQAEVTGSAVQDEQKAFQESLTPLYEKRSALVGNLRAAQAEEDEATYEEIMSQYEALNEEIQQAQKDFVEKNPASFITPSILRGLQYGMSPEEMEAAVEKLDPSLDATQIVKDLKERIEILKKVAIGQPAPDFTMNDPEGNPVKLSDQFGKYLLVDFWAAWCGPCRRENPHVVAVWEEYHDKGFDVFGVSLDQSKEDWLKAIEDDKLTWKHVSDLEYWNNAAAKMYGVNSIPANFLLDPEGTIIATNLRGDALKEKVAELLD